MCVLFKAKCYEMTADSTSCLPPDTYPLRDTERVLSWPVISVFEWMCSFGCGTVPWDRIPKTLVISLWWGWERSLETNWESRIDIHSLSCVKWVARGMLLCSTGSPAWCSAMTRRGAMRQWEEGSRRRGYMYPYSWFTVLYIRNYWKAIYTPIKKKDNLPE